MASSFSLKLLAKLAVASFDWSTWAFKSDRSWSRSIWHCANSLVTELSFLFVSFPSLSFESKSELVWINSWRENVTVKNALIFLGGGGSEIPYIFWLSPEFRNLHLQKFKENVVLLKVLNIMNDIWIFFSLPFEFTSYSLFFIHIFYL